MHVDTHVKGTLLTDAIRGHQNIPRRCEIKVRHYIQTLLRSSSRSPSASNIHGTRRNSEQSLASSPTFCSALQHTAVLPDYTNCIQHDSMAAMQCLSAFTNRLEWRTWFLHFDTPSICDPVIHVFHLPSLRLSKEIKSNEKRKLEYKKKTKVPLHLQTVESSVRL